MAFLKIWLRKQFFQCFVAVIIKGLPALLVIHVTKTYKLPEKVPISMNLVTVLAISASSLKKKEKYFVIQMLKICIPKV